MSKSIESYDATDSADVERLKRKIASVLDASKDEHDDDDEDGDIEITPFDDLIGIPEEVYRQINDSLRSGDKHLMFYGPPGTGKTTLAQRVAAVLDEDWRLLTGSADWTSQDVVGGYHPLAGGGLRFMAGFLLEHFDKPVIFDELNRCDIDKVIGPLFTVLSGQGTTLPYLADPSNPDESPRVQVVPRGQDDRPRIFAPGKRWRILATINSIDKASLYQMSYALTRRFAWIYVDAPSDINDFVIQYVRREKWQPEPADDAESPLAQLWKSVNDVRVVGPAPILDMIRFVRARHAAFDFFAIPDENASRAYLDAFYVFLLPMLDGILVDQAQRVADGICEALKIDGSPVKLVQKRLQTVAV